MTSKDISMMKIRCYLCPKVTDMHKDLPLGQYLMLARDDTNVKNICEYLKVHEKGQDDYDKMKMSNRCATISCICEDGTRKDSSVLVRNPLIVVDIDQDDNPCLRDGNSRMELFYRLFKIKCCYAAGISCSGKGIYLIIYIGHNIDDFDFKGAFFALEKEFMDADIKIDKKCKNISRLRYASSHDLLIKSASIEIEPYLRRVEKEQERIEPSLHYYGNSFGCSPREILSEVVTMLIEGGFRADDYNSWISCGFALQPLGTLGLELFDRISQASNKYGGFNEVAKKYSELYKPSVTENDCYAKFYAIAKRILGPGYYFEAQRRILHRKIYSTK